MMSPAVVNKYSLRFLMRHGQDVRTHWHWLREEERRTVAELLRHRAMTTRGICEALGLEYNRKNSLRVNDMMKSLAHKGSIRKLVPGFTRGQGAVFGTDDSQLEQIEPSLIADYHPDKRSTRLALWVKRLIAEEPGLDYKGIIRRLEEKWHIASERSEVIGILHLNLLRRGIVKAVRDRERNRFYLT